MKALAFLYFILFLSAPVAAQQTSAIVHWTALIKKVSAVEYQLNLDGVVKSNWYVYAKSDSSVRLEAPYIIWDEQKFIKTGGLVVRKPVLIRDPVFGKYLPVCNKKLEFSQNLHFDGDVPQQLVFVINAYASDGKEFLPLSDTLTAYIHGGVHKNHLSSVILPNFDLKKPMASCGHGQATKQRLLATFLLGLFAGFLALMTPCVFPMVPVTVSYFTSRSKCRQMALRNGLLYGGFILLIYLLASIPFHVFASVDPRLFNSVATNPGVNLFFFVVFVAFALSFFGLFEIRLPSAVSNLAGNRSGLSNVAGIFFMALVLVVVSFSCTGPILGSLLVSSLSSHGAWQLSSGMAGFGLALGFPFALFAMFPRWMQKLPKSGAWMEVVKKSLAFVELGLSLKFLSNADLVQHWGILKREVFLGTWSLIATALAVYLLCIPDRRKRKGPKVDGLWGGFCQDRSLAWRHCYFPCI